MRSSVRRRFWAIGEMVAPAPSRHAFLVWTSALTLGGLRRLRGQDGGAICPSQCAALSLVHVRGIDFLAREAELQDFDVFGTVENLAGEHALDDDAHPAKGDAYGRGDAKK